MTNVYFITHPEVQVDPAVPVPQWRLSSRGRERMQALLAAPWLGEIAAVWCSAERKAMEAAEIVGRTIGSAPQALAALGENDRSATGYLPEALFEATADTFFADPMASILGWETAFDAQRRIVAAIEIVLAISPAGRDVAVISHGAVGALLLCKLKACPISRSEDQPGRGGGNYFCFERETYSLRHGWRPIDAVAA